MKIFRRPLAGLLFCTMPFWAGCGTGDKPEAPVSLTWETVSYTHLDVYKRQLMFMFFMLMLMSFMLMLIFLMVVVPMSFFLLLFGNLAFYSADPAG